MDKYEQRTAKFFAAMDRVRRAWHSVVPCREISKSQFATLMAIKHYGSGEKTSVTMSALAAVMNQSVPALSQRVRDLERMGYVERVPDEKDRRISGVCLSMEGNDILGVARKRIRDIMDRAIDELGPENAEKLTELLSLLAGAFEKAVSESRKESAE